MVKFLKVRIVATIPNSRAARTPAQTAPGRRLDGITASSLARATVLAVFLRDGSRRRARRRVGDPRG